MNDDETLRRALEEALKEAYKEIFGYDPSTENPFEKLYRSLTGNPDETFKRLYESLIGNSSRKKEDLFEGPVIPRLTGTLELPYPLTSQEEYFREIANPADEVKSEAAKRKKELIKENKAAIPTGPFEEFYRQENPFPEQNFPRISDHKKMSDDEALRRAVEKALKEAYKEIFGYYPSTENPFGSSEPYKFGGILENPFPEQNFPKIEKFYKINSDEEPGQKKPDGLEGKL